MVHYCLVHLYNLPTMPNMVRAVDVIRDLKEICDRPPSASNEHLLLNHLTKLSTVTSRMKTFELEKVSKDTRALMNTLSNKGPPQIQQEVSKLRIEWSKRVSAAPKSTMSSSAAAPTSKRKMIDMTADITHDESSTKSQKLDKALVQQTAAVHPFSGSQHSATTKSPTECISHMINKVIHTYIDTATLAKAEHEKKVNDVIARNRKAFKMYQKDVAQYDAAFNAALQHKESFEFLYEFQSGKWMQIDNDECITQLTKLVTKPPSATSVKYTIGGHQYEATVLQLPSGPVGAGSGEVRIVQKNLSHCAHTERNIRWVKCQKPVLPKKPVRPVPYPQPRCVWPIQLLTGGLALQIFDASTITTYLKEHDFADSNPSVVCPSPHIASLATFFSSFSTKYTYNPHLCEMWVKPAALQIILLTMKSRNYTRGRLVMHGSSNYEALRNDPFGFDITHSKEHGNRYGPGLYVGLSDKVPTHYNRSSNYPDGTGIIGIVMFPDTPPTKGHSIQYSISNLSATDPRGQRVNDCCFIRTPQSVFLPLGFAVAQRPGVATATWEKVVDNTSGDVYYWNPQTNVTSWTKPTT